MVLVYCFASSVSCLLCCLWPTKNLSSCSNTRSRCCFFLHDFCAMQSNPCMSSWWFSRSSPWGLKQDAATVSG